MKKDIKKTKRNLKETEIVVVLDRSGSMMSIAPATVEGFNQFLNEQQNAKGKAFITLVQFDDRYEVNYKSIPVKEAPGLILGQSFVPRGSTALLDAIGKTIQELETNRDVVFVIITDGFENASKEYKHEAIKKMIDTLTKEQHWKFLYLGANQDAIQTGGDLGICASNSVTYAATTSGASNVFLSMSSNTANYRSAKAGYAGPIGVEGLKGVEGELRFTDDQRELSSK